MKTREQIDKMKKSVADAREAIKQGLILDDEAVDQMYRMIWYEEDEIERAEKALMDKGMKGLALIKRYEELRNEKMNVTIDNPLDDEKVMKYTGIAKEMEYLEELDCKEEKE